MKIILPFIFGLFMFFTSCESGSAEANVESPPAPLFEINDGDLTIPVYNENTLEYYLNRKDEKVHIVNFWATWCAPCIKELPYFEQINEEFSDEELDVTLVSLDFEYQLETRLLPYVQKNLKSKVIVVLPEDEQLLIEKVSKNWQNGAIPVTLIYNKNKSYFIDGETTYKELKEKIEEFKL